MKIEDGYVIFEPTDNVKIEPKRISGHSFVELLGLNKFTLKGDALLYMFNILHRNVDDIYQKRGEFAEKLVKRWLEQRGKTCITYDSKIVKYTNFSNNQIFWEKNEKKRYFPTFLHFFCFLFGRMKKKSYLCSEIKKKG